MEVFKLDEYMSRIGNTEPESHNLIQNTTLNENIKNFNALCDAIKENFSNEWESDTSGFETILERQKRAIIGYQQEVNYFKDKIESYLKNNKIIDPWHPHWYTDIKDAIFQENWGLAGLSEWVKAQSRELAGSSSAKIIGDRIYFLLDGTLRMQPQKMSQERRKQLRKALLLKTPKKRISDDYHEVYMLDGTRITIYGEGKTKEGQDTIVFRKFFVKDYTFEKQVDMGTIPAESVPLFKSMIKAGYNVAFTGAVRTAKTTFLTTWQSYEDQRLEGVSVETDPEIPFHLIMPRAPILQLVADGEELEKIVKSIMRSDADYIILGEARDGTALNIAVKIANKGTRRVKMTFHTTDTMDFCYDIADEIIKKYGGSLFSTILKVSRSFQFVFQFVQLRDKSKKRLKSIYEIQYDPINHEVTMHQICKYDHVTDDWTWDAELSENVLSFGEEEDMDAVKEMKAVLNDLAKKRPIQGQTCFKPAYSHLRTGG